MVLHLKILSYPNTLILGKWAKLKLWLRSLLLFSRKVCWVSFFYLYTFKVKHGVTIDSPCKIPSIIKFDLNRTYNDPSMTLFNAIVASRCKIYLGIKIRNLYWQSAIIYLPLFAHTLMQFLNIHIVTIKVKICYNLSFVYVTTLLA